MFQIGAALFYYKLGQTLLQIGGTSLLQIGASDITNWGSYYNLGQPLLQNRAVITNWGKIYYKLEQVLQIRAIITNWGKKNTTKIVRELGCLIFLIRWGRERVVDYMKKSKKSYPFFYSNIPLPSPSARLIMFPKFFSNLSFVRFQVFDILIPSAYLPS